METIEEKAVETPNPEEAKKKNLARKRLFYVLIALIIVMVGLIAWATLEHIV